MHDCLIVGGGVVGVSLAYELAKRGQKVRIVERGEPGRESSWAGAGIFPPASKHPDAPPLERLTAFSLRLHAQQAEQLRAATGIDTGFRRCGGWYFADDDATLAELQQMIAGWQVGGITVETPPLDAVRDMEPVFADAVASGRLKQAAMLPDEVQVRNPWHMRALLAACESLGVDVTCNAPVEEFDVSGDQIGGVVTPQGRFTAATYCICTGAWSGLVAAQLGAPVLVKPIRGQIVLLSLPRQILKRIVYVGKHYLVPRDEGRILIGSTLEDVGFNSTTTASAVQELVQFALDWSPDFANAQVERCWAGLRPMSLDGLPYLGRLPGLQNGFVAAGHYRSGLLLAPATAVVMADMIAGQKTVAAGHGAGDAQRPSASADFSFAVEPPLDLRPFSPERKAAHGR